MAKLYPILLFLTFLGCSHVYGPQPSPKPDGYSHIKSLLDTEEVVELSEQEKEIVALIVHEYFQISAMIFHHIREAGLKYTVYLQIFEKNPSQQLLNKIGDQFFNVTPAYKGITSYGNVSIPNTNYLAELFVIESIDISDNEVFVSAFTYKSPLNALGFEIKLIPTTGGFEIDKWEYTWQS